MREWLLLLAVIGSITANTVCQRDFFAQPVVYDRAMNIDFYYTAINLPSVAECAAFCGDRHFCRTAVYNIFAKTCAISYEYTLNCRYNEDRMKEFDMKNTSSHLVQIACVTKCNEASPSRASKRGQSISADSEELPSATPATLKKVQLITGEPNDGFRFSPPKLARSRPAITHDSIQEPGFVNKLVIENFTSGRILPVLDSKNTIRKKGQICNRLKEKKYLMGAVYETHKDTSLQTCRCLCAHSYAQNTIFMCKSFNWRADGTCELNKGNHLGRYDLVDDNRYIYQYIDCDVQVLMGIAAKFCTKEGKAISSTTTTTTETPTTTILTSTSTEAPIELTSATNPPELSTLVTTLEILPTTEAFGQATIVEVPKKKMKEEETTSSNPITSAEERAGFVVGPRKENSQEVSTTTEELEITTEVARSPTKEVVTETVTTTKVVPSELPSTNAPTTAETLSTTEVLITTDIATTTKTTSAEALITTDVPVTTEASTSPSTTTNAPKITEESTTKTETSTTIVTETTKITTTRNLDKDLDIERTPCYERIAGYMLGSAAAALEHDISLEECECFCANSRASGRHGFECSSATYYHGERDCVLNLEDRFQKSKYFTKQIDFNVTYLGLTCPRDKAISNLVNLDKPYGCRATPQVAKPKKTKTKGAFSDQCFTELPSYVLEGNALHVETNTTPQRCKCLCLAAEKTLGEACQSFQYYYEGAVCLLSKDNRYSNAQNFTFLPDQQLRSYFEYKCASKEEKLKKYMEQMCLFQKVIDDAPAQKTNTSATDDVSRPSTILKEKSVEEEKVTPAVEGSGQETETTTASVEKTTTLAKEETIISTTEPTTTEITTTAEDTTTTTSTTTTTTPIPTTTKKMKTRRPINRDIPEAEGLDDSDFEELEDILSNHLEEPSSPSPLKKVHGVKTIKFTDKVEKAVQEDTTSTTVTKPPTTTLTTTKRPTTTTRKITTPTTTKAPQYPSAGKCTYSALYQTAFFGRRTIKTVHVKTAADCFAACFALHCRSANLIAQGALNQCELFKDSLIDYRRPDMIGYDGSTVYFDGIQCDGI